MSRALLVRRPHGQVSTDKPAVFAETFRVLAPGRRIGVGDVIADNALTPAQRAERGDCAGCIASALSFAEYAHGLAAAGFTDIEITATHPVADGMHSAAVRDQARHGPRAITRRG